MASISLPWNAACSRVNLETALDCEGPYRLDTVTLTIILSDADDDTVLLTGSSHPTCYKGIIELFSFELSVLWLWTTIPEKA